MSKTTKTDAIFQALANATRRLMMDLVKRNPGCCVNDLCEHFSMSRIGVMKHLGILVDSGLVISRKNGRTRELFFNAAPIQLIYDRWTDEYSAFWATQVVDLKYQIERKTKPAKNKKTNKAVPKKNKTTAKRKTKVAKA